MFKLTVFSLLLALSAPVTYGSHEDSKEKCSCSKECKEKCEKGKSENCQCKECGCKKTSQCH
jgi:hypothetical protein